MASAPSPTRPRRRASGIKSRDLATLACSARCSRTCGRWGSRRSISTTWAPRRRTSCRCGSACSRIHSRDPVKASSGCLGENTIDALGRRALSSEARQAAVDHLDGCEDCRVLIAAVGHDTIAVASTLSGLSSSSEAEGPARAQLRPGDRVGRYTVLHKVGAGGMGVVFAAYDPQLDRRVALKLVHHGVLSAGSWEIAAARLLREAQALARLSHPNVITVFDAGRFEGLVFLTMELLPDGTLGQWLDAQPRAPALIVERFLEAGRGLAAAHAAGIVHRDFKPDNVLVGREGHARVTDFGLARVAGPGSDDG
ncbi:MAG: serine/threonine protein kinase, partial [Myxococcales bacterium]|nr:serine/threonine protein kinase [Myxococcales bacterium]